MAQIFHLLYEVNIIEEEFDAQEKGKRHIRSSFLRIVLPSIWGHFNEFGIRINKEKLIFCTNFKMKDKRCQY